MLVDDHMVLPDLEQDGLKEWLLDGDEDGVVDGDGEVLELKGVEGTGEVEAVLVVEGEILVSDLTGCADVKVVEVDVKVPQHNNALLFRHPVQKVLKSVEFHPGREYI